MSGQSEPRYGSVNSDSQGVEPPSIASPSGELPLGERVYRVLRQEIIEARRAAGSELRERDIALELDVSRVPVRAALPRLEAGGFVRIEPRRPAVVTHISFDDVDELYDLRAPVEATVARLAARSVGEGADPSPLLRAVASAERAHADGDHPAFVEANIAVHREIVALAANPLLERVMAPLVDRTDRLNRVSQHHDRVHRHSEHEILVDAVVSGNVELAASAAVVHIERERARALATLPSHPHFAG